MIRYNPLLLYALSIVPCAAFLQHPGPRIIPSAQVAASTHAPPIPLLSSVDTGTTTDTTQPPLTGDVLHHMMMFWIWCQHESSAGCKELSTAPQLAIAFHVGGALEQSVVSGSSVTDFYSHPPGVNMITVAAQVPAIATALRRVQLTPRQWEQYCRSLYAAYAADRLHTFGLPWPADMTTEQNTTVLHAHRQDVFAMVVAGLELPNVPKLAKFVRSADSLGRMPYATDVFDTISTPSIVSRQTLHASDVQRASVPESLVGEAVIRPEPNGIIKDVFLPVTVGGKQGTLLLDTGYPIGIALFGKVMASLGMPVPHANVLDTLTIGTTVLRHVPVDPNGEINTGGYDAGTPAGLAPVIGMMGSHVLAHYDLLFDGPAQRVRLYVPQDASSLGDTPTAPWFPAGLTAADCVPLVPLGDLNALNVGLVLRVNGHPVVGIFDAGSSSTNMNVALAKAVGIRQSSPHVHRVFSDSAISMSGGGPQATQTWVVTTGVQIQLNHYQFADGPVNIFPSIEELNGDQHTPQLDLGTDIVRDWLFFISYTRQLVCLGQPGRAAP